MFYVDRKRFEACNLRILVVIELQHSLNKEWPLGHLLCTYLVFLMQTSDDIYDTDDTQ